DGACFLFHAVSLPVIIMRDDSGGFCSNGRKSPVNRHYRKTGGGENTMCGRYALTLGPRDIQDLYAVLAEIEDFPPRYNIAPTQPVLAVWQEAGRRVARLVRWGLVPGWVKDPRAFPLLINARSETMMEKPAFKNSVRNQRCIVPASGYYEWRTGPDGAKTPFYITFADGAPMSLAGLLSTWAGPNGEEVDTVALVTTDANAELAAVHNRMPAILEGE